MYVLDEVEENLVEDAGGDIQVGCARRYGED